MPVWFLREGETILVYSKPDTPKLRNIAANPRVALHLDGDGKGGDIVVLTCTASVSDDPRADQVPAYVERYAALIESLGWTPSSFAADYSIALRLRIERLSGH